jgi:3-dehydroquinate synthase
VKAELVEKDPAESGPRRLLNFGHTFGHALEAATRYERWLHGEAVALGMAVALGVGAELGTTSRAEKTRVRQLLTALGLHCGEPLALPLIDAAIAELGRDKKSLGNAVQLIVLRDIGTAEQRVVPLEELATLVKKAALELC